MNRTIRCAVVLFLSATGLAHADYNLPQLEEVPIDRVAANLEPRLEQALQHPADRSRIYLLMSNLARINAMRYAYGEQILRLQKTSDPDSVILYRDSGPGHERAIPLLRPAGAAYVAADRASLQRAIDLYRQLLARYPDDMVAVLGLAWSLQQDGQLAEAQSLYQGMIEKILDGLAEKIPASGGWFSRSRSRDDRLRVLLDMTREQQFEIGSSFGWAKVRFAQEAAEYLQKIYRSTDQQTAVRQLAFEQSVLDAATTILPGRMPITPIAIPLRSGLQPGDLIDRLARVDFDLDGNGWRCWQWLNDNAAWLVYRQPGVFGVNSGRQLFGAVTFSMFWDNGYQALATLDNNGDGQLSGDELRGLALWRDLNRNGMAEPDEIEGSLADSGIRALSVHSLPAAGPADYVAMSPGGVEFADGLRRDSFDLLIAPCDGKVLPPAGRTVVQ